MSGEVRQLAAPRGRTSLWRPHFPQLVLLGAVALVLTALGPEVWLVLPGDGLLTAGVLAAALGWGAWPTIGLGLGRREAGQQTCISIALGLGLLGMLTLVLGAAGVLTRLIAWAIMAIGWGLAIVWLYRLQKPGWFRAGESEPATQATRPGHHAGAWRSDLWCSIANSALALTVAVPLAIALFAACLPPGILWNGEARGYDALEYHLQGPREYFDAGRIHFLPHNVYASFPQQMETLYLLLMQLAGSPLAGALPAQLLHAACGILAVLALVAWTPPGWPRRIVMLAAGSVPWLAYLGCLAYVELGMLFFAAVAAGLVLDHLVAAGGSPAVGGDVPAGAPADRDLPGDRPVGYGATLAAGLCAGLAAGCKYTALVLVPAALGVAWFCTLRGSLAHRVRRLALFAVGALAAFSPWLIRNAALTGNPVYPFAYRWFDGVGWSTEQAEQWARGHRLPATRDSLAGRAEIVWDELFASRMFGPALFVLAFTSLLIARSRAAAMLVIWFALIVAGWAVLTHMPGRFVVPAIVPLVLLCGFTRTGMANRSPQHEQGGGLGSSPVAGPVGSGRWRPSVPGTGAMTAVLACIVAAGAVVNNVTLADLFRTHRQWWTRAGLPLRLLVGSTESFAQIQPLNAVIPAAGKVWLVGEARAFYLPSRVHYTVVFSRDPWLEYSRKATPEESVAWLRTQNVSRVVFSWSEIARLQGSYGFPMLVTPQWVEALLAAGLRRVELPPEVRGGDIEVCEVPPG